MIYDNAPLSNGAIIVGGIGQSGLTYTLQNTTIRDNAGYAIYHYSFDVAPSYRNLTLQNNGVDAVYLGGGNFNRNVTLDSRELGGKPYISGSITVISGYALTLAPGTLLQLGTGSGLSVLSGATLNAVGSASEPITITSTAPDKTFNYIFFNPPGSIGNLDYVDISRAAGAQAAIFIQSSNVSINHSVIHDNAPLSNGAIIVGGIGQSGLSYTLQNTTIRDNAGYAIYHYSFDVAPSYRNLTLQNNGVDAVYLGGGDFNRNVTLDSRELGGKPYISGSILVRPGYTLTMAQGTTLKMENASLLQVLSGATLNVTGTRPSQSFSPPHPAGSTICDFHAGSTASLDYCDVSNAGNVQGIVWLESSNVLIDHCTIHDNTPSNGAIFLNAPGLSPTIRNTSLVSNSNIPPSYAVWQSTADMSPVYENLIAVGK